ncbi:MAG: hypothetical protein PHI23_04000 [Candidatus Peribacteraceae bacterium]|nr:hypothetical protein [Candidatus Peribacteraceae bacterium]
MKSTIEHPEAGRFDPHDRAMLRGAGIHVEPPLAAPGAPADSDIADAAQRAEEIRTRVASFIDLPV